MYANILRVTGLDGKGQWRAFLVAGGHGSTHWIIATFYILVPYIRSDLELSYAEAGVFASVFFCSSFIANAGSGAIVDITGRRVFLQCLSLLIGGGALLVLGAAEGIWLIISMLIFIGATNNLWHPAAISYLSDLYPNNRGYVLSIHTLGASLGDMIAPLVAGILLVGMTWQMTAVVSAMPIFVMAVVLYLTLAERRTNGSDEDRNSPGSLGISGADYIKGILHLVCNVPFVGICLMAAFRSMAQNGLLFFLPLLMLDELGFGSLFLGLALMALQTGGMIAGPVAGTLSDYTGRRPVALISLAATTVVIALLSNINTSTLFVIVLVLLGFTLFAVRPVIHSWTMDLTPRELGGSAISVLFAAQAGFSAAVPIVGGLVADEWGLDKVFYGLAGCMAIATVIVYFLPATKPNS